MRRILGGGGLEGYYSSCGERGVWELSRKDKFVMEREDCIGREKYDFFLYLWFWCTT